ncbi:MAG: hypothetical protein SGPRY_000125 [Prymnesium sp.]
MSPLVDAHKKCCKGYEVFDEVPSGEPPLAAFTKTTAEWKRNEFEGSLRLWYRYMVVEGAEALTSIRRAWHAALGRLPANDDPHNLDPALKPKWGELPKYSQPTQQMHDNTYLQGVGSHLENPPINPIVGPGRTTAEVERELRGYQAWMRRNRDDARVECTPVFQGDYLIMTLPTSPLFLARVVHNCCIDDATNPELTFTAAEYLHTPQQHVTGLFGVFTKKKNTVYNPCDKRTGGKFVRHSNIPRDAILVYNVDTWVDRVLLAQIAADHSEPHDCIRIAATSLRQLAEVRPEFTLPEKIPATHASQDEARQAANAGEVQREREARGSSSAFHDLDEAAHIGHTE